MRRTFATLLILVAFLCVQGLAGEMTATVLTNESTDAAKARMGFEVAEAWEIGLTGSYYLNEDDRPWSAGLFAKMVVNPTGEIALKNWLPGIGDLLNLPETVPASTYIIAEGQVTPVGSGDIDFIASVGPGVAIGFITVELLYNIAEGGTTDSPIITSGMTVWFGIGPINF